MLLEGGGGHARSSLPLDARPRSDEGIRNKEERIKEVFKDLI